MKELYTFRKFLAEGQINENLDPQDIKVLDVTIDSFMTQGDEGPPLKVGDVLTYEWEDEDMEIKGEIPSKFVKFDEDEDTKYEVKKVGENEYEFKVTIKKELNEGAFGDKTKTALENRLTGMAKAMVEDGDLFAEGGNVTYDEADLKDGATPEQIEAIDQIKAAVIEMGGRVSYGEIDKDGILTYMYIVVDEPPTYDAVLKVITKESEGDNFFYDVFKSSK